MPFTQAVAGMRPCTPEGVEVFMLFCLLPRRACIHRPVSVPVWKWCWIYLVVRHEHEGVMAYKMLSPRVRSARG